MIKINPSNIDKFTKRGNYYYYKVNRYTYLQFDAYSLEYIGAILYINYYSDKEVFKTLETLISVDYLEVLGNDE